MRVPEKKTDSVQHKDVTDRAEPKSEVGQQSQMSVDARVERLEKAVTALVQVVSNNGSSTGIPVPGMPTPIDGSGGQPPGQSPLAPALGNVLAQFLAGQNKPEISPLEQLAMDSLKGDIKLKEIIVEKMVGRAAENMARGKE